MIEVQHLTKRYGPVTAVDDVSFKAERGEILGFLGPNGAGKTTTMRVLTGYMPATDGKAIVAGYDVLEQPVEAKRRTGYLPETPPLYPDMTVSDYLAFCARIKGVPRSERATRLRNVMERTQIADVAKRHCAKLSKGYRQRVGLAQALLQFCSRFHRSHVRTGEEHSFRFWPIHADCDLAYLRGRHLRGQSCIGEVQPARLDDFETRSA